MKKVIELIRVSTAGQAGSDRASIPAQVTVNRRTCAHHGLENVRSIQIADVSGASVLLTPEMQHLIRLMQSPEIHGVVTREFSRLMRPEDFADYALLQVFADTKTMLYLPEGPIDFSSKTGRLMGTIRAAIAGAERIEILERVWGAKEEKRRRGELAQSHIVLPFGVGYEQGRGFFYKPEAERVRAAFQQFLGGNQSYKNLAQMVGVSPRGMSLILRNPIWTGWRVIDMKRDPSSAGKYKGVGGRQTDRRKINREPEDVICIKVIETPLIGKENFDAVQHLMDVKRKKHWRTETDYVHRFTYNGFLTCSACGGVIHTALARRDYYACKGRRIDHKCPSKYMAREKLEREIDELFSVRLMSRAFLASCVGAVQKRPEQTGPEGTSQRLTHDIDALRRRRERVIDSFIEGILDNVQRDVRLATIDHDIRSMQDMRARRVAPNVMNIDDLVEIFAPLTEWEYWSREEKRLLLSTLAPDIRVADYRIESLGLNPVIFSNENIHTGMDSWPQPA